MPENFREKKFLSRIADFLLLPVIWIARFLKVHAEHCRIFNNKLGNVFCVLWLSVSMANAEDGSMSRYDFDIRSQSLSESLSELSNQTETLLLFPYDLVENLRGNAVKGRYTVKEALDQMIEGTGLIGLISDRGVLTISNMESDGSNNEDESNNERVETMKTQKKLFASMFGTILGLGATGTSTAQTGIRALEEIVVTAQRREQSLQDVPIAVSAMTSDDIVNRGLRSLSDIQPGTIPSVNFQSFANNPSVLIVSARGVATPGVTGTTERPVPIYIDGVYLGRAIGSGIDLIDPERIEVLRGPQGQLFGRNAEGGVVQYVTRKPSGEFGVKASASIGNYNDQRYRLSVDLPKFAGFSTMLSAIRSEHDGYTDNEQAPQQTYQPPSPQKDYGLLDAEGYRVAVRWQSQDNRVTADYSYDDSDQEDTQPYGTWTPVNAFVPANSPLPPSGDYPNESLLRQYNPGFDVKALGHGLTLEWQATDAITLKSISSYREAGREGGTNLASSRPVISSPLGNVFVVSSEVVDQEQQSQEFQLIGLWEQFDLAAGAIYYKEEVYDERTDFLTGPLAPVAFGGVDPYQAGDLRQESKTESYGLYSQGTYRPVGFDNRLELILGLRYSDDSKDARRFYNLTAGGPVDQPVIFAEERLDPAFTVRYEFSNRLSAYLRYATGYRAGGANVRAVEFTSFGAEESIVWEAGLKSQLFDNRLKFNSAIFHNTIEDEQLTIGSDPVNNPTRVNTINSPLDKKVKGLEVEVFWTATNFLDLGFNFSYMDADDFQDVINPFDSSGNTVNRIWSLQTPETSGSFFVNYVRPLSVGELGIHISYSWSDDYYTTPGALSTSSFPANFDRPASDSSQLAARVGWGYIPVGEGDLSVSLWGKNLTDDAGIAYGFDGCASGGGFCTLRAVPRTYGLELRYQY